MTKIKNKLLSLKPRLSVVSGYVVAVSLGVIILTWMMKLHQVDWRIPLSYHGDSLFYHLIVKGVVDHGWFLDNNTLGAPDGMNLRDVPTSDNNYYFLLLRLLSFFSKDYALVMNLFFLLSFPLTIICALAVWRHFKLSWPVAIFGSLLYTFFPFHFTRGQHHLFLSSYYLVPLMCLVILWISMGRPGLKEAGNNSVSRNPKIIISAAICVLIGSTGYYYAFFACFLLLVAGMTASLRNRSMRAMLMPVALIALICGTLVLNLLPSLVQISREGTAPIVRRLPAEADVYGLKIAQMLLPLSGHRISWLAGLKTEYNQRLFINENDDSTLGFIGSFGFLFLVGWLFYRKPEAQLMNEGNNEGVLNHLSLLAIASVLLATTGGIGSMFSLLISPQIRAYNRIVIYIAFFSIFAVLILLEKLDRRFSGSTKQRLVFVLIVAVLLVAGLRDQRSHRFFPNYNQLKADFSHDAEFVHRIESTMPRGAMIFQLPVVIFPESPKLNRLNDYDLGRGYLHSHSLRWSYGAIKGSEGEAWQRIVTNKPVNEMIETVALAGFSGIYLDRHGYADSGARIEGELSAALQTQPLTSGNGRLIFYDLTPYQQRLKDMYSAQEWDVKTEQAIHPLMAVWRRGFSDQEGTLENHWRWGEADAEILIVNRTPRDQRAVLEMSFAAGNQANLRIKSSFFEEQLKISKDNQSFTRTVTIPPGKHVIRFSSDAQRILSPIDFREMVFRVHNFKLQRVGLSEAASKS